jgi:hypothetical protein
LHRCKIVCRIDAAAAEKSPQPRYAWAFASSGPATAPDFPLSVLPTPVLHSCEFSHGDDPGKASGRHLQQSEITYKKIFFEDLEHWYAGCDGK